MSAETGTAKGEVRIEEPSRAQQTLARRVSESRATVPDFSVGTEADMERAIASGDRPDDLVVRAAATALTEFPRANAAYRDGRFELYGRVNIGVAVTSADGLVFPTIFDADQKDVATIAAETRALEARVHDGVITAGELRGGTFSVANLGAYGVTEFQAVINAPQAAILAVGALRRLPRVVGDEIVPRHVLPLTLVCDHRILYGADAARFLARIKQLLEEPSGLAV
jgi:pyruvate dehydrogenase E2 component (dihydrolipoamide acetyltransferase)